MKIILVVCHGKEANLEEQTLKELTLCFQKNPFQRIGQDSATGGLWVLLVKKIANNTR